MASSRVVPWKDEFREFFELAGPDWTPPAAVRSSVNAKRDRMTMVGRFHQPDGTEVKLTSLCEREGATWYLVEQRLDLRMTFEVH